MLSDCFIYLYLWDLRFCGFRHQRLRLVGRNQLSKNLRLARWQTSVQLFPPSSGRSSTSSPVATSAEQDASASRINAFIDDWYSVVRPPTPRRHSRYLWPDPPHVLPSDSDHLAAGRRLVCWAYHLLVIQAHFPAVWMSRRPSFLCGQQLFSIRMALWVPHPVINQRLTQGLARGDN